MTIDEKKPYTGAFAALSRWIDRLLSPHASVIEPGARRQASLLAGLSLLLLIFNTLGIFGSLAAHGLQGYTAQFALSLFLDISMLAVYLLAVSRYHRVGSWVAVAVLSSMPYLHLVLNYGPDLPVSSVLFIYLLLAFVVASILLGVWELATVVVVNCVIGFLLPVFNNALPMGEMQPAMGTISAIGAMLILGTLVRNTVERDRLRQLQAANQELGVLRDNLEQRVAGRTRSLQTSYEVSRHLSTILDRKQLAVAVVEDVQKAFSYYHVQIYLFDEAGENLNLAGGTGEAGRILLSRGHQVRSGKGLVGWAAASNQPVLVSDTRSDSAWLPNPLLPDTQAEIAVPISVGDKVLGVLDVQQNEVASLAEHDMELLQAIANQVAVALQNTSQYEQTQTALQEANMFRQFAQSAGQGMAVSGLDGKAIYINPALAKMIELGSPAEMLGRKSDQIYPAETREKMRTEIMPAVLRGGQWSGELQVTSKSGVIRPTFENIFMLRGAEGSPTYIANLITDISERKKTQEVEARQANELARVAEISTTVANLQNPTELLQQVVDITREKFNFYFANIFLVNPAGDSLEMVVGSGETGRKLVARSWRIPLSHPHSLVARAASSHQGVTVNDVSTIPEFVTDASLPRTVSEMAVPLLVGDTLLGVLDVQSEQPGRFAEADVSIMTTLAAQVAVALQNARQYQQTRQSEELIRMIINATPDWIFIKDRDHRYRLVNQGYASSLNLSVEDMLGKDDLDLGQPEELVKGNPEKGISGFWVDDDQVMASRQRLVIPSEQVMVLGQPRYLTVIKAPMENERGEIWGVLGLGRDITESESLQKETEQRLAEVNALYRSMSREGWQAYQGTGTHQNSFFFDQSKVQPAPSRWTDEIRQAMQQQTVIRSGSGTPIVAAPLSLRGNVIGALAIEDDPQKPLTDEELALLEQMSDQVAQALESARLFEQTQTALSTTEALYAGSEGVVRSSTSQDVLQAIVTATALRDFSNSSILLFDTAWGDEPPDGGTLVAAYLNNPPEAGERDAMAGSIRVGSYLETRNNPFIGLVKRDQPLFVGDTQNDPRLAPHIRQMLQHMGRSIAIFPLVAGEQWIGWLLTTSNGIIQLSDEQIRQIQTLSSQAATVLQSLNLLEQTQARARYEQVLREVTSRVRASSDPDTVLRTAVREVGSLLGRNVLIRLGAPREQQSGQPVPPAAPQSVEIPPSGNGHGKE